MNGTCCTPDCHARTCGDDGCGGSCGTCEVGLSCSPQLMCEYSSNASFCADVDSDAVRQTASAYIQPRSQRSVRGSNAHALHAAQSFNGSAVWNERGRRKWLEDAYCPPQGTCVIQVPIPVPGGASVTRDTVIVGGRNTTKASVEYRSIDLSPLCNSTGDYIIADNLAHTFYAQICGVARQQCVPESWDVYAQFGAVVQTWGSRPECSSSTWQLSECPGLPAVCPSVACKVTASALVPPNSISVPSDPADGAFTVTYNGSAPTRSDMYRCDFDPNTGTLYPSITTYAFHCDATLNSTTARLVKVDVNVTDDCDHTLHFNTSLACFAP